MEIITIESNWNPSVSTPLSSLQIGTASLLKSLLPPNEMVRNTG
uniref:Uncharacterized protein n=1 Tax=Anguilla anguilla TaxID=7936 RepID=A0A0E9XB38_ANGAN